jgi:uncharacterized membrane protein (DUF2068 family)
MAQTSDDSTAEPTSTAIEPLRWIGAYKLLKAALSLIAALLILRLMHRDLPEVAQRWMARLHIEPQSLVGKVILNRILLVKKGSLGLAAGALLAYVPLGVAEGIGLILRKVWAEWLALIITAALIPLEVYEIVQRPTALRVLILIANLAVLVYLIVRLRRDRTKRASRAVRSFIPGVPAEADFARSTVPRPPVPRSNVPE